MPKVLMLILASDDSLIYRQLQDIWRAYMKSNSNIDCYFYKGDPTLPTEYKLDDDILWIRIEESLDTVYEKTLKAFQYFSEMLCNYDFVFRPNISSFVVFDKYIDYCNTIPKRNFVSAVVGEYGGYTFPSGSGFTMSTDIVLELVKDNPPAVFVDDVTIGKWLHLKNIPIHSVARCDYTTDSEIPIYRGTNAFHYRVKNTDRTLDLQIHKHLLKLHYGK